MVIHEYERKTHEKTKNCFCSYIILFKKKLLNKFSMYQKINNNNNSWFCQPNLTVKISSLQSKDIITSNSHPIGWAKKKKTTFLIPKA